MKYLAPVALSMALLAATPQASADTATLTIDGSVVTGTCTLNSKTIALAPLKATEATAGLNGVEENSFQFTNCSGVSWAKVDFDGSPDDGDATYWKNTATGTAASGVAIALLRERTGSEYLSNGDKNKELRVSGISSSFYVRAGYYVANPATVSAGDVSTSITLTASYE